MGASDLMWAPLSTPGQPRPAASDDAAFYKEADQVAMDLMKAHTGCAELDWSAARAA